MAETDDTTPKTPEGDPRWTDAEWIAQAERDVADLDARRASKRRERDRYYFAQGLATGLAVPVILMVVAWSLWS